MSGPDINRPRVGSNAIGSFVIGVSPIGDIIPQFDYWQTILSQYANSPILCKMIDNWSSCIDQTQNLENFFDNIVNIYSAQGYGLDVWGRIVGVNRVLSVGTPGKYLGFNEGGTASYDPFNQSPFYSGQPITTNFALTDTAYRTLILAKAFANISDGSTLSINKLLSSIFHTRGNAYVIDNFDMTMIYAFTFRLTALELAIIGNSGVITKPSGVSVTIQQPNF